MTVCHTHSQSMGRYSEDPTILDVNMFGILRMPKRSSMIIFTVAEIVAESLVRMPQGFHSELVLLGLLEKVCV